MAKIPTLNESEPILKPVALETKAEAYEDFAKIISGTSKVVEEGLNIIAKDKSNSMYLASIANIDQLKLSTQELILSDPTNATKHVETFRDSLDKVKSIAYVNETDRKRLNHYAQQSLTGIELEGIKTNVKQSRIAIENDHYKNWPYQLNALYQTALSGDEKKIDSLKDSMIKHLESMTKVSAMTPLQMGNAIAVMDHTIEKAHGVHKILSKAEDHTPEKFHEATNFPLEVNKTKNVNYPADENTRWMTDYHSSNRTFEDIRNDLYDHKIDVQGIENLTPHQLAQIDIEQQGINAADGLINSNAPLFKIENRLKELKNQVGYKAIGERRTLSNYVDAVKNGDTQRLMARTALGGNIVQNYTMKSAYLNSMLQNQEPENLTAIKELQNEIARNKNDFVNKTIAYGQGHGWPVINPIPKEDIALMDNAFKLGSDPREALNAFKGYSKENQLYFADQMKNISHKVILQTIANGAGSDQENLDYIAANQSGMDFSKLDIEKDNLTQNSFTAAVSSGINDAMEVINAQYDAPFSTALNNKLISSAVNYSKYLAIKNLHLTKGTNTYIPDATKFIKNSYEKMSGANYIVNKKQVSYSPQDMDYISQYAIDKANEYVKSHVSPTEYEALRSQASLFSTVSPTGDLIVKDSLGSIWYSQPLTGDLAAKAREEGITKREENLKRVKQYFKPLRIIKQMKGQAMFSGENE